MFVFYFYVCFTFEPSQLCSGNTMQDACQAAAGRHGCRMRADSHAAAVVVPSALRWRWDQAGSWAGAMARNPVHSRVSVMPDEAAENRDSRIGYHQGGLVSPYDLQLARHSTYNQIRRPPYRKFHTNLLLSIRIFAYSSRGRESPPFHSRDRE